MSNTDMDLANKAMDQTKYVFISNPTGVFMSTLLFSQQLKWDALCPTAYTNGLEIELTLITS